MCASGYLYLLECTFELNAIINIKVPSLPINIEIDSMINPASEKFEVIPIDKPTVENALNSSNIS